MTFQIPGFAGGGFVALAGTRYAAAGCALQVAHPGGQHTFSGAVHTPIRNIDKQTTVNVKCAC